MSIFQFVACLFISYIFLKTVFIYLRGTGKESYHILVHSLRTFDGWGWASAKAESHEA